MPENLTLMFVQFINEHVITDVFVHSNPDIAPQWKKKQQLSTVTIQLDGGKLHFVDTCV